MKTQLAERQGFPRGRLVMILSSERSGSTLLRVMLGEHSRVVAPSEMFLMRYADYDEWRAQKPMAMRSLLEIFDAIEVPMTAAKVDEACAGMCTADVYRWLLELLPPGWSLVDKTPAYANDLETLARSHALDPHYVWLIRHPLGVVDSHVRLKEREFPFRLKPKVGQRLLAPLGRIVRRLRGGMGAVAREREMRWTMQNANIRTFLRSVDSRRWRMVRFEDLVASPQPVLASVCDSLGISLEPSMLRPEQRSRMQNPHLGDPNFHRHDGVDVHLAHRWRGRYSESRLRFETTQLMRQIVTTRATPTIPYLPDRFDRGDLGSDVG